ncbi:MAG TPA: acyl-CoA dehydrogenase family protein [Acidimicrobiales bacterium]|jgi:alkylation response protein AidB-like acyl-CoA dehydrogenase|nr:acyl-CoA dehydrogenase family protein [Acidimicrobiales bacterium]
MNFDDTPDEAAFRAEARAWLAANAPSKGSDDDFSARWNDVSLAPPEIQESLAVEYAELCRGWQATLFKGGWAGLTWPEAFGGRGLGAAEATIFAEEQAEFGVSNGAFMVAIGMVGPTLIAHASPDQKARLLGAMLRGEHLWCQLFSEPGAGSDLAGLTTRAVRDGDEWVVNGQKVWTSNATTADWGILLARTNPAAPKHHGITFFVVDMTSPGIEIRPLRQMTGESHFAEVFLTDLRLPADAVVGEVDGGWGVARTTLANERASIGGQGRFTTDDLVAVARRFGRLNDPGVRQQLAGLHATGECLRFMGYRLRTAISQGRQPGAEANCMKLLQARYLKDASRFAVGVQGPAGMIDHTAVSGDEYWKHLLLSAPSIRIAGGSDEVQRNIIGERVLGLPRDPRPQEENR